jgi:hypothetical protein
LRLLTLVADAFNLLDKVLLHEMTHGRGAHSEIDDENFLNEGLDDVKTPGGIFGFGLLEPAAYGWSKARKLAEKGQPLGQRKAADNNADTLALFGSSTFSHFRSELKRRLTLCSLQIDG